MLRETESRLAVLIDADNASAKNLKHMKGVGK